MTKDNEKLFDALDKITYVNRKDNFMMLPNEEEDEKPFLLSQLKHQLQYAIKEYCKDSANSERVKFYRLDKENQ